MRIISAMKIHLSPNAGNAIEEVAEKSVVIGGAVFGAPLIVGADFSPRAWLPPPVLPFGESGDFLQALAQCATAGGVALLGAGAKPPAPRPQWQAAFVAKGAVLEVMSLRAACRTYNILLADGRAVCAALVFGGG